MALSESGYLALLEIFEADARKLATKLGIDWDDAMRSGPESHTPAKQALVVSSLGLFDEEYYRSSYADINTDGIDPLAHYINLGDAEGRRPNRVFDPQFYRTQFDDLKSVSALYHYAIFGEELGLKASSAFSPRRYLLSNPQLQTWPVRPLTHYLHLGKKYGLTVNHRARLSTAQEIKFERNVLPEKPRNVDPLAGVNVIGPLDRVSGLGVSARGYLDGLRKAGITKIGCQAQQREFAIQSSIEAAPAFPPFLADASLNLVHMNGDTLPVMIERGGESLLKDKYNVAVWYWELPTLRPEWQVSMKYFHEFWAPTPFIYRAIKQSTSKPVRLVPPYLGYLEGLTRYPNSNPGETRFVYCFDANSILERKNPSALVDAFLHAFPIEKEDAVKLTFKITYPNRSVPEVNYLYESAARDNRIQIIDHLLSDSELHELIGSASAYVSPHRSEGLGLTVIEAMGAGVPVISTPFGGVDTFVDPATSFPLDYRLIELEDDYIPYPKGFVWADPIVESIATQLRSVHEDRANAEGKAALAKRRVMDYFCSPKLIACYRAELKRISRL